MGRRSTKTTKTGKFMNPTDQWRKQQRRRELKKNKKQRRVVRDAVLRMKDVGQMLDEIEEIEKIQMTSLGEEPLPNEKGLEEKKGKLHATIYRVSQYYQIEDPKKAQELKQLVMESEKRRRDMSKVYNSYRAARSQYSIDEIPLPESGEGDGAMMLPSDIPMPDDTWPNDEGLPHPPTGLLPPGPPSAPPPSDLPEYVVLESERKSVRFAESSAADASGPSDDDLSSESDDEDNSDSDSEDDDDKLIPPGPPPGPPPTRLLTAPPLHAPPPPPLLGPGFPPRIGLPPGPPPGIPPPRFGGPPLPLMPPNPNRPHIQSVAVLSAPPTRLLGAPNEEEPEISTAPSKPTNAVISAQPQLRNMTAEVTKFMPTSLRVRRNHPKPNKMKPKPTPPVSTRLVPPKQTVGRKLPPGASHGDAYDAFMKEMQGLL